MTSYDATTLARRAEALWRMNYKKGRVNPEHAQAVMDWVGPQRPTTLVKGDLETFRAFATWRVAKNRLDLEDREMIDRAVRAIGGSHLWGRKVAVLLVAMIDQ